MEKQKFIVDIDFLNGIGEYLSKRPWIEVDPYMRALASLRPMDLPPEPSAPDDRYPEERPEYD